MSSIELEKTEEITKDLGELKPKRKYVKKVKPVEVDLTPPVVSKEPEPEPEPAKEKKPRTEAQKLAFEKCLETKRVKAEERKSQREQQLSELKEEKLMRAEDKIVKQGVRLQKKALIQLAIEEGDDIDIPDEIVKKVLKRRASKATQPKQPIQSPVPHRTPPQSPSRKFSFVDN